jgi:pyridoxal phosphate enzyme (YggS family)
VFDSAALRARLAGVRDRIARAAGRVGRDPASITLVAVSKTFTADHVRVLADAGHLDFGENKVQEALRKIDETADLPIRWHLVGHLQSNKASRVGGFYAVHSVDSASLLGKIDAAASAQARTIRALVQVDLTGEATKFGVPPAEVAAILERSATCAAAPLVGLMVLPPAVEDPESARPFFATLRALRDRLTRPACPLPELSMGMSHDFEVAIEEGATMVRVGSAIFGSRTLP